MNPEFPIFVPTKGRYDSLLTIKAFELIRVPYMAVIEKQEYPNYSKVIDKSKILVLPHQNKGLTVTRNWIWDYAEKELKTDYFWTFDDNIRSFYRLHKNIKYRLDSGNFLYAIEQFSQRYSNLYISGMAYEMFAPRKRKHPPFIMNTRIYSNMFIKTKIPYRNRLFYNDDTDLCLQILKAGYCTCQFVAFLADKMHTMTVKGGMTDYYNKTNSRLEFAKELKNAHPDCVKISWKFGRWHHQVDYRPFKNNKLIRKIGIKIDPGVNNYGMKLIDCSKHQEEHQERHTEQCRPTRRTYDRNHHGPRA